MIEVTLGNFSPSHFSSLLDFQQQNFNVDIFPHLQIASESRDCSSGQIERERALLAFDVPPGDA